MRGNLPPVHYFFLSPAKGVKSPAPMEKESRQACKISRISGETLKNKYFDNFYRQEGMQPKKIIYTYQFKFQNDVKLSINLTRSKIVLAKGMSNPQIIYLSI